MVITKDNIKSKVEKSTLRKGINKTGETLMKTPTQKSDKVHKNIPNLRYTKQNQIVSNLAKVEIRLSVNEESEDNSTFLHNCFKDRRKAIFWSKEEEAFLVEGIKKHGKGNWKSILEDFKTKFNENRRYRDLSDKVRVLENESSYKKQPRMEYFEVDQADEPIRNLMGEKIIYYCKFPNEAAAKAAKTKSISSDEKIIKICLELANEKWFHVYRACRRGGRIRIRKISGRSIYRKDGY